MLFEPVLPYVAGEARVKFATAPWERDGALALRRQVFCREQRLFERDDRDDTDSRAIALVALAPIFGVPDQVVGTVRIHEDAPGLWGGSRLAVEPAWRRLGALGSGLIRLAVSSATARGCRRFLAHVQAQNAPLFHRLHWQTLDVVDLHGCDHHLMEADLAHYPPFPAGEAGFAVLIGRGR
ncbi:MSMEG_0567/Sll0786 family nitrogen starvation N-acetyltransferase [Zavarzinia compransoris]|uniref:Histone acetyltransferase n=1 Tax=Zavarzinia compransoris TaxID=1264899 RepID=A0A317E4N9_9PROT|nr:MSMEG_0567/Sll0786 family nitrogen starvation N-acetyltransferase [Zavarzinia compransoris]PWR22027.1 histone acetyltransferase [Zavarzinia compransoris]TDP47232.1 putative N-acetyltransferase (TIGR04045 family) [Zavarzinia compransoris]